MKVCKILSAAGIAAALLTVSPAQAEQLSRGNAIARALRQNPQIAAARARRAQTEAEKEQADAARLPEVTLELGVGPGLRAELVPGTGARSTESRYDLSFDDLSVTFGGRLSVVQPLYTFGKIDAYRKAASYGIRARQAQVEMTRAEVALEVARLYEGLLFARDLTRFFEELEHSVERTIGATEQRLADKVAEVSEQDVLRLQSALAAVQLSLHQTRAGQAQASAGLIAYLGLAEDATIEPREDRLLALGSVRASSRSLSAGALTRRPELAALEHGAQAHDALADAEQAGNLPDVFVLAFATGAYTPGRDLVESRYIIDPLYHFDPGIFLGMRWQFQGDMASGKADQRRAQARELRHLKSWAQAGVPAQVKKAHEDAVRAQRDMRVAHAGVGRAKKWMVRASADYLVGLETSQALVDATRAYAELRAAELDATYRHNVALAELAHATGTLVSGGPVLYPRKDSR